MKHNKGNEVKPIWLVVLLVFAVSWALTVTVLNIKGRYLRVMVGRSNGLPISTQMIDCTGDCGCN